MVRWVELSSVEVYTTVLPDLEYLLVGWPGRSVYPASVSFPKLQKSPSRRHRCHS